MKIAKVIVEQFVQTALLIVSVIAAISGDYPQATYLLVLVIAIEVTDQLNGKE